jgi:hypothetical protein
MAGTDDGSSGPEYSPAGSVQVWLNDQDSTWYDQDYLNSIYVDDNIVNFAIQPDVGNLLNIDEQTLTLYYQNGEQYSLVLGSIADVGTSAEKWYQALSQLIIPADASLSPMFSIRTTPNLWKLRYGLNILMQQLNDQRIEIGGIVYSFAKMIDATANNNMSDIINDLRKADSGS